MYLLLLTKYLEHLYNETIEGAKLRSRCQWTEEGETNTKFFFALEKTRQKQKAILELEDENGNVTENQDNIIISPQTFMINFFNQHVLMITNVRNTIMK